VIDFGGVKEIAELGAGDGQLALLFAQKGYSTVILDTDDWRDPEVYQSDIKFVKVEESAEYEIPDNSVDLFVSYGTLEHVADPHYVLQEAIRVTRPGGNIFLLFGPLYNSPWGLHAYETFYAPYPQFLLSESTMKRFVEANGIWDLGAKRENFQYVNGWSARNYDELIDSLMGQVSIRHLSKTYCYKEIDVVYKYLRSFIGCGLDFEELTREEMTVCLTVRDKARTGYGSHDEILIKQSELQNDAQAA
jgi:SAM-dependent methyltransferase